MSHNATPEGLFTLGLPPEDYHLPHPRLGLPVILLVRLVVLRAFKMLEERGFSLATKTENEITTALRGIIESDLRQKGSVNGFNTRTYEFVVGQGEVPNFDFSNLTKAPDLCFKLRNNEQEPRPVVSVYDALFVECKRIDEDNSAGSWYCAKGLCKFVNGDYAWAMEEALMLGYARDSRSIEEHLIPAMRSSNRLERLKTVELPQPDPHPGAAARGNAEALHVSRHRRGFPWVGGKGPATDIFIYHSWHRCD